MSDHLSTPARVTRSSADVTTSGSDSERHPRSARRATRRSARLQSANNLPKDSTSTTNGQLQVPESPSKSRQIRTPSPGPLGIIPIHSHFRSFIHRHEIPRKALHVSIGFLTLTLYAKGYQVDQIHPVLLYAFVPIAACDVLRHNIPSFNKTYVTLMGALMRESEVDGYNGVIWYLAGTWAVLRFFPKDIGVMGVLLLSWCDTAASTVGRLWGRYTPRIRRGKSLAGSTAAFAVGIITAWTFWGWAVPRFEAPTVFGGPPNGLAFQGSLSLPSSAKNLLGWSDESAQISGPAALSVLSIWTGLVASASEAVDLFGWDDNFTIPICTGIGLFTFLKVFGTL